MKQGQFNQMKDILKSNYDISFGLYLNAMQVILRINTSADDIEQVRMLMSDINSLSNELKKLIDAIKNSESDSD